MKPSFVFLLVVCFLLASIPASAQQDTKSAEDSSAQEEAEATHEPDGEQGEQTLQEQVTQAAEEDEVAEALADELDHLRCPQLCGQHEACINMRCISTCKPACEEGTYCTPDGECRKRRGPKRDEPTEGELQSRHGKESADSTSAAVLDVGGVMGLGVRPTYEWGAMHSFQLRYQIMSTGAMPHVMEPLTEFERFEWGFGTWFGYRRYEAKWGNLRGFYYGGGLGYSVVRLRDNQKRVAGITTHYVTPYGEFGYRWVFGSFLFGFGPAVAVRFPAFTHFNSLGEGSCVVANDCQRDSPSRFEGTMTVEIGLML